jgi:hypothetical protein
VSANAGEKATLNEVRRLEAAISALEERHQRRLANREAAREAPRAQRKPKKSELQRCGCRTRAPGNPPCQAPVLVTRGSDGAVRIHRTCRMHGSASSGPVSPEGRARCAEGGRKGAAERWRRAREAKATAEAAKKDRDG